MKPRIGPITESVYASVTLQPDSSYAAYAVVSGIVSEIFVEEGEQLKKGDKILQITNEAQALYTTNAKLALELAQKKKVGDGAILKGIEEEIRTAQLNLGYDSINFIRQKHLWEQGIGTQNEFDTRKLSFAIAKRRLSVLENQYERTKSELNTQVKQAENNFKASQVTTKDYTIYSRIDGRAYQLFKEPGELVIQQEPVAKLGSASSFKLEMLIDEVDIAKVEVGMKVLVTLDAYEGEVFQARLQRIYPQKNERTQTFTVEALFDQKPTRLFPGLSGEANIIINEKQAALIIPRIYLMEGNKVNTEAGIQSVETGIYNMEEIEILAGLDTSTYLLKPE